MDRTAHANRPNRESISKKLGKRISSGIRARDNNVCAYCNRDAVQSGAHLHFDHLTPRSHGGADEVTNLVLACRRCNSARGNMTVAEFARYAAVKFDLSFTAITIRAQARRSLPC